MRLSDALDLREREVIAIVGGGGKTTVMYRLARETAAGGAFAVATGTTLFTPPPVHERPRVIIEDDRDALVAAVAGAAGPGSWVIASAGHGNKGRLLPIAPDALATLAVLPSVTRVIAEADGSRGRAFKAPGDHEPVVPPAATLVVAVAGMTVVGQPLDAEHVHRPEGVAGLIGAAEGGPVTAEMIAAVLANVRGGRKDVPRGCRFAVLLNQCDGGRLDDARRVATLLRASGVPLVVLARAREDPPVIEVLS